MRGFGVLPVERILGTQRRATPRGGGVARVGLVGPPSIHPSLKIQKRQPSGVRDGSAFREKEAASILGESRHTAHTMQ